MVKKDLRLRRRDAHPGEPADPAAGHRLRPALQGRIADRRLNTWSCPRRDERTRWSAWRSGETVPAKGGSYDRLSEYVAHGFNLSDHLHRFEIEHSDRRADVRRCREGDRPQLEGPGDLDRRHDQRRGRAGHRHQRQAGHWALPCVPGAHVDSPQGTARGLRGTGHRRRVLRPEEQASGTASTSTTPPRCIGPTKTELFRFDQLYRHFCEYCRVCQHWNIVKQLREQIEAAYSNWYVTDDRSGLGQVRRRRPADEWKIKDVPNEYEFYHKHVDHDWKKPRTAKPTSSSAMPSATKLAQELTQELNGKYRFEAALSSQLACCHRTRPWAWPACCRTKRWQYNAKGNILSTASHAASWTSGTKSSSRSTAWRARPTTCSP